MSAVGVKQTDQNQTTASVCASFRCIPIVGADTLYQHETAVLLTAICD